MGADHSSACYGLALLPVSFVWDVFKFSGIALCSFLMLSGIMILLTGGFWPFAAETAARWDM